MRSSSHVLSRCDSGGYSVEVGHGSAADPLYLRIVRSFEEDAQGVPYRSRPRWELLDNGNEIETFTTLRECREYLARTYTVLEREKV